MHLLGLSSKQSLIIPLLLSVPIHAAASGYQRRGNVCCGASCDDEADEDEEAGPEDGGIVGGTAGMGVEFESGTVQMVSVNGCSDAETFESKGKMIANRQGTNWMLTADTMAAGDGLDAEYILDGKTIKIGKDMAGPAAAGVAADIVSLTGLLIMVFV